MRSQERRKNRSYKGYTSTLRRLCVDCEQYFFASGRNTKYCNKCMSIRYKNVGSPKGIKKVLLLDQSIERDLKRLEKGNKPKYGDNLK